MNESEPNSRAKLPGGSSNRRWVLVTALVGVTVFGVLVDRCAQGRGRPLALEGARRIWLGPELTPLADGQESAAVSHSPTNAPVAFWAVKDFDLSAQQIERGAQSARLLVRGDPEVMVYWNGILVHSEAYRLGQDVTVLNVGPLLEARNRVILAGRSRTGAGGLLGALWMELPASREAAADPVWVTDSSWQVLRHFDHELLAGFSSLEQVRGIEPAKTWSGQDLGRWRPLVIAEQPSAVSWPSRRQERTYPLARIAYAGATAAAGETEPWPSGVLYTFAESVHGCLAIAGESLFPRRLFFFEDRDVLEQIKGPLEFALENGLGPAAVDEYVVPMKGARLWYDSVHRRFSRVLLEGKGGGELRTRETVWVQACAAQNKGVLAPQRLRWNKL